MAGMCVTMGKGIPEINFLIKEILFFTATTSFSDSILKPAVRKGQLGEKT